MCTSSYCNRATRTLEKGAEVVADTPKPNILDNVVDKLVPRSWLLLHANMWPKLHTIGM